MASQFHQIANLLEKVCVHTLDFLIESLDRIDRILSEIANKREIEKIFRNLIYTHTDTRAQHNAGLPLLLLFFVLRSQHAFFHEMNFSSCRVAPFLDDVHR